MNRLGDYLYVLARSMEAEETELPEEKPVLKPQKETEMTEKNNALIEEILRRVNDNRKINLETAKKLTEKIEEEARRRGKQAVIAVCGPEGNPISVHVMDGAFLVSFDVAMKKAYTSVAVKMSTKELSVLAQPGGTFYGVDKMDGGKIVIFGGGIPLKVDGRIIGGLGISAAPVRKTILWQSTDCPSFRKSYKNTRTFGGFLQNFRPEVFLCTFLESLIY